MFKLGNIRIEIKYYIVHKYKYKNMHWWEGSFKSYLTGFSFPNTGLPNDPSRLGNGLMIESWNCEKCTRKLFDLDEANIILDTLLNNYLTYKSELVVFKYNKFYIKPYYKFSWSK